VRHRIGDVHEVERSLSLVATLGYELPSDDEGALAVRRRLAVNPVDPAHLPYTVVHPGASVPARAWSPSRAAALVDELIGRGRRVVVTGSREERRLTSAVAGPCRDNMLDLGGETTLPELVEVLAEADVVVAGNTGPAHLAAAVQTPIVSLFAPVVPARRWRPWRVPHVLLGDQDAPCRDSRARQCPIPGHPCLDSIQVETVARAVDLLARSSVEAAA
jgi:ADP-heptose:LPS heptosyltransferase